MHPVHPQSELITQEARDAELARRVQAAIADRFFPALARIQVDVRWGVASLSGQTPTSYERRLARYRARGVLGIVGVIDAIEVGSPGAGASGPESSTLHYVGWGASRSYRELPALRAAAASGIELGDRANLLVRRMAVAISRSA